MPFSITQIFVFGSQDSIGIIGTRLWNGRPRTRRLILAERKMFIYSSTYPKKILEPTQPTLRWETGTPFLGGKRPWYVV
jgi:hypothetical protein